MTRATQVYSTGKQQTLLILFDTADDQQYGLLNEMRTLFRGYCFVEPLSDRYYVVRLLPGNALELLR